MTAIKIKRQYQIAKMLHKLGQDVLANLYLRAAYGVSYED